MEQSKDLSEPEIKKWGEKILQHSFDEDEWFRARSSLMRKLDFDQMNADENAILSYISCCAEAVGGTFPLPSLSDSVIEFYEQYGMENALKNIK